MNQVNSGKVAAGVGQKRKVYMDFAPRGATTTRPVMRQRAAGPVVLKPDARAAQANARIAQKQAQEEARQRAVRRAKMGLPGTKAPGLEGAGRPVQAQAARPVRPQARVGQATPAPQRPLSQGRPVMRQTMVAEAQVTHTAAGRLVEQEAYEEIDFGVIEDYQTEQPVKKNAADSGANSGVATKESERGPNWPFLKSVTVEKRPLSGKVGVPKKKATPQPTTVTPAASSIALNSGVAKKGSKLPMVGLILLTIILGVAVGAAVYFAIFQGGGPE